MVPRDTGRLCTASLRPLLEPRSLNDTKRCLQDSSYRHLLTVHHKGRYDAAMTGRNQNRSGEVGKASGGQPSDGEQGGGKALLSPEQHRQLARDASRRLARAGMPVLPTLI